MNITRMMQPSRGSTVLCPAGMWHVTQLIYISLTYIIPVMAQGNSLTTPEYKAASNLMTLCIPGTCRNGQCYTVGSKAQCYCHAQFRGSNCEQVDLDKVSFSVIGSIVIFQWEHPPRLTGYSFVYYELDNPDSFLYKTDILMQDNEHAALVGNLKGGHTMYRICIEDEMLADRVVNQNALEYLTNCVNISTQPDYHTLVAYCIAAMLACVALLLIYFQKDKFELLYFSKPVFLMYEQTVTEKESSQVNSLQSSGHLSPDRVTTKRASQLSTSNMTTKPAITNHEP